MVTGDCHNHGDAVPEEKLPPINNNIGFVYFRPTAMVTRAIYNWVSRGRPVALSTALWRHTPCTLPSLGAPRRHARAAHLRNLPWRMAQSAVGTCLTCDAA